METQFQHTDKQKFNNFFYTAGELTESYLTGDLRTKNLDIMLFETLKNFRLI